jgi:hypothetical protein
VTEQVVVAGQLLANARSSRDQLGLESADANRQLSEAVLAVITHTERVESTNRLLALAESCVGQIRARMRAHGISINPHSASVNAVTPAPDVNGEVKQG